MFSLHQIIKFQPKKGCFKACSAVILLFYTNNENNYKVKLKQTFN